MVFTVVTVSAVVYLNTEWESTHAILRYIIVNHKYKLHSHIQYSNRMLDAGYVHTLDFYEQHQDNESHYIQILQQALLHTLKKLDGKNLLPPYQLISFIFPPFYDLNNSVSKGVSSPTHPEIIDSKQTCNKPIPDGPKWRSLHLVPTHSLLAN